MARAMGREVTGMVFMGAAGAGLAVMVMLSDWAQAVGLPYYSLMGSAELILGAALTAWTIARGQVAAVSRRQWKWVVLRGFAGAVFFVLSLLAVAAGAPLGDVSALQSFNIVVAALLGRAFLGEQLRALHIAALCASVIGALMVSKAGTLVFAVAAPGTPWLGYALALLGGVVSGSLFIAARKSQGIDPLVMTASVTLQEGLLAWAVPLLGIVPPEQLAIWQRSPLECTGILAGFTLLVLGASVTLSAGSQLCPAVASSTIFTSVSMTCSYVGQVALGGAAPEADTVAGAALMLLAVGLMALARRRDAPPPAAGERAAAAAGGREEVELSSAGSGSFSAEIAADDESETASLASFAASEFSGVSLRGRGVPRLRAVSAPAQIVGAASA